MQEKDNHTFYSNGLQFECTKCGKCCSGFPGYVYLSENDIKNILEYLKLDKVSMVKKYAKVINVFGEKRFSLIEKNNFDCIFFDKICTIYHIRPYQCRAYPFWKRYLISQREWNKAGEFCKGINSGKIYSNEEIEAFLNNVPNYDITKFSLQFN